MTGAKQAVDVDVLRADAKLLLRMITHKNNSSDSPWQLSRHSQTIKSTT